MSKFTNDKHQGKSIEEIEAKSYEAWITAVGVTEHPATEEKLADPSSAFMLKQGYYELGSEEPIETYYDENPNELDTAEPEVVRSTHDQQEKN